MLYPHYLPLRTFAETGNDIQRQAEPDTCRRSVTNPLASFRFFQWCGQVEGVTLEGFPALPYSSQCMSSPRRKKYLEHDLHCYHSHRRWDMRHCSITSSSTQIAFSMLLQLWAVPNQGVLHNPIVLTERCTWAISAWLVVRVLRLESQKISVGLFPSIFDQLFASWPVPYSLAQNGLRSLGQVLFVAHKPEMLVLSSTFNLGRCPGRESECRRRKWKHEAQNLRAAAKPSRRSQWT